MPQDTPSRHLDQFLVRFPDGLRDRIADIAKANNRSMNSEIVARLEASFTDADRRWDDADLMEMATKLAEMLQQGSTARKARTTPTKD